MKQIKLSEVSRMGATDLFSSVDNDEQTVIVISGRGVSDDKQYQVTKSECHEGAIPLKDFKLSVGNTLKALKAGEHVVVGLRVSGAPPKSGEIMFKRAYQVTAL
ncbi:hypothetical protein NVP1123O_11 [Vibrio phage 1.123.O._10N.286.48.F3]|nr:hypothetical protein NVP1123O_11 [Vibrio phage 1.123.O._10N.286.48.F3]